MLQPLMSCKIQMLATTLPIMSLDAAVTLIPTLATQPLQPPIIAPTYEQPSRLVDPSECELDQAQHSEAKQCNARHLDI